jgi:hypothetical protein
VPLARDADELKRLKGKGSETMDTITAPASADSAEPKTGETIIDQFAIVEIFGHRKHAGRIMEVELYGTKMLRIDIPTEGDFDKGFTSHFYGGGSIFSVSPCTLEYVKQINQPYQRPALMSPARIADDTGDGDDDQDELGL